MPVETRPAAPTLDMSEEDGVVTATLTGEAGITGLTHYLYYASDSDTEWQPGGSREGDGDIEVEGLSNNARYIFIAVSEGEGGQFSKPSKRAIVILGQVSEETEFEYVIKDEAGFYIDQFGEPVTYFPDGGGLRQIKAIIDRQDPARLEGAPHGVSPSLTITVMNDSVEGISSSEFESGGDKVEIATIHGKSAQPRRLVGIVSHDAGMVTFLVR